jgi:hypothetical protein
LGLISAGEPGTLSRTWPQGHHVPRQRFLRDLTKLGEGRAIELDAIRGLAILLAVGSHINRYTGNGVVDAVLAPGILFGEAGVDIFFVLSGFLIGGLILREIENTGHFRAGRFLVRRAFRLWPVLYLFLLMQLVRQAFPAGQFLPQVLLNVQNYFRTPLSHLWSLAVEEQFYFAAALVLPFLVRRNLSARSLFLGLAAVGIVSGGLRTIMVLRGADPLSIQSETHYRLDVLIVGILLALVKLRRPRYSRGFQRHRGLAAAFAVAICGRRLEAVSCRCRATRWPPASSTATVSGFSFRRAPSLKAPSMMALAWASVSSVAGMVSSSVLVMGRLRPAVGSRSRYRKIGQTDRKICSILGDQGPHIASAISPPRLRRIISTREPGNRRSP